MCHKMLNIIHHFLNYFLNDCHNVALNITRVKLCHKDNPNYNKLKLYWKLIIKNKNDLSDKNFYSKHFRKYISRKDIVTYLINTNKVLKATYESYQGIINSIKKKGF